MLWMLALGITSTLATLPADPRADDQRAARVAWLLEHSFAFDTVEAGHGFADLEPLRSAVGAARIVSLGEPTHGTREVFQMKHRLLEYLASELGFSTFSIEASSPESFAVGDWVRGGAGDPHLLVEGMYFWTWHTEEVLAMVQWMRAYNESEPRPEGAAGRLDFTGFDMQTPDVAMGIVLDFLGRREPDWAPRARQLYDGLDEARGSSSAFGVATGNFPIEAARGKHLVFSADIRTDLSTGYAGLWWRADVPDSAPAFDNMHATGPRGRTEWQRYTIELDVPAETTNINFGMLVPGQGSAWFDDLCIELDGEAWTDPAFGLDFEDAQVQGFFSPPGIYGVRTTIDDSTSGKRCLEIAYEGEGALTADEAAERAHGVVQHIEERRGDYGAPAREVEWALQNARIVEQCLLSRAGDSSRTRDRSMADNVEWLASARPDERLVLWAHNGHVARRPGWMGHYLDQSLGDEQLVVGFATSYGEYYAMGGGASSERVHPLAIPPEDSFESLLEELGDPLVIVDLRSAEEGSEESGWLFEPMPFRSIGALAMDQQFYPTSLAGEYDLIVYLRDTSAARQLPWKTER